MLTTDPAIEHLATRASDWIVTQRDRLRPSATPMHEAVRRFLAPHFASSTLDSVRFLRVPYIENPDFYSELDEIPLDLRQSAGITYGDTVLISERAVPVAPSVDLVFHELVHVAQYSVLGIPGFARRYVMGWAENGFEYPRIPLEAQAYALERRFSEGDLVGRRVEERVREALEGG